MDCPEISTGDIFTIGLLAIQTLGAVVAAVFAWKAYNQTRTISCQQREQTQTINREQLNQTEKIHSEQLLLAEKQAFIALFEHLKDIQYIDIDDPNWTDAAKSANLLELIAVAWEKEIVDKELLFDIYGSLLVTVCNQIWDAKDKDTGEQRGHKMLMDNASVFSLYSLWKTRKNIKDEELSSKSVAN